MKEHSGKTITQRLLLSILITGVVMAFFFGGRHLNFQTVQENYTEMVAWRNANILLAALGYMILYTAAVALSIPGAIWLTLIGGFLFGTVAGSAMVIVSATLGATLIFLAARSTLGRMLRERAGDWIRSMETGFRKGEVSYLLIMRLVPAVPFFVANLVPAFLGARLRTFVWTTLIGISPGTVVYVSIGAGLGTQLETGQPPDLGAIFEPHIFGPLLGLAALSALPLVLKTPGPRSDNKD